MNRASLVKLGQSGEHWRFIEACIRHGIDFGTGPDPGLTYLLAQNTVQLGLPDIAQRLLGGLSGAAAAAGPVVDLRRDLDILVPRTVPVADRLARAEVLRPKFLASGIDTANFDSVLERLAERESKVTVSVSRDGREVRTPLVAGDVRRWVGPWSDEGATSLDAIEPLNTENAPPITIEGMTSPEPLVRVAGATPPFPSGFHRGIYVVEPSLETALGAAVADRTAASALAEARTRLFVGPDAGELFESFLASRRAVESIGPWVGSPTAARAAERLQTAARAKAAFGEHLREQVLSGSAERDSVFWARRYRDALAGQRGLRVLIPTCLFSTYIQHASRGLAEAFRRAGHRAEVVIEPDESTPLSNTSFLDACARFDPDLIVLVNYPRATRPDAFPADVPFVCWIQDHMPQIYDERVGRAQGPLDFTLGHTPPELYERLGFPAERSLASPVVVNPAEFFEGEIDPADRDQHACDIAYVSHQSETFEALTNRLRAEIAGGASGRTGRALTSVIDHLIPAVRQSVARLAHEPISPALTIAVWNAMDHAGLDRSNAGLEATLLHAAAWPMAERLVRHQTLDWAADLAERDGLKLRVYGNGWDRHPRLAPFAAGPLEHGKALRASYASATIHLHPTTRAAAHQRVLECVLSGGFPLVSFYLDATPIDTQLAARLRLDPRSAAGRNAAGELVFYRADHPGLLRDAVWRQEMGLPVRATVEVDEAYLRERNAAPRPEGHTLSLPAGLFPSLRPFVFTDREDFENRITSLIGDNNERRMWADVLKRRVKADYSLDGLVDRLLPFVRDRLETVAGDTGPASTTATDEAAA